MIFHLLPMKFSSMILILIIYLSSSVNAQGNPFQCIPNGNYTRNSTYSTNLNALLNSLSSNMTDNGFYASSVGQSPNTANGFALCRADRTLDECRACVISATREVLLSCPNQRQAAIWYEYCTLRYSNDPIHREQTAENPVYLLNTQNVTDGDRFKQERASLLGDLTAQAANGTSALKAGAGTRNYSDTTIYALVQCTPDFSSEDCWSCLVEIAQGMGNYISQGFRVLHPDCNLRYELTGFYNDSRLREIGVVLPPPQPPATSPPGSNGNNNNNTRQSNTTKVILIIAIPVGVTLTFVASAIFFMRKRMNQRAYETLKSARQHRKYGPTAQVGAKTDRICIMRIRIINSPHLKDIYEIFTENGMCYTVKLVGTHPQKILLRVESAADDVNYVQSLQYDFSKIRGATGGFNDANKLGEGGFGAVYKGRLKTGEEIAVKRLSKGSQQGNMEFKNEVSLVAQLQHKNLVRLLGFAMEGKERALVYEFVQNASLDRFIFDPIKRSLLDWDKRYQIIWGIVKGILYLHEDSRLKIIHRDLKVSNVLVDGDLNPKIADFGMARLFEPDETHANTSKIVGTYGYMSPEYAIHGQFSTKSDVFSFGVLVLEILTGRRNASIPKWGASGGPLDHYMEEVAMIGRTAAMMMDPVLRNEAGSIHDMVRCIHIGLLCVQENAANRPTMASVVRMLSRSTMTLPVPSEPAFYVDSHFGPVDLAFQQYDSNVSSKSKKGVPEGLSQNDVSITELFPR